MTGLVELLTTFSPMTIIVACIMILIALKGTIEYKHWLESENEKRFQERRTKEERSEQMLEILETHNQEIKSINNTLTKVNNTIDNLKTEIDLLAQSDKDDIKAFITREYHYFIEQKGWIDDYSMDCIEKRYSHYVKYHGNTFVEELMEGLRALPRRYEDRIVKK